VKKLPTSEAVVLLALATRPEPLAQGVGYNVVSGHCKHNGITSFIIAKNKNILMA